MVDCLDDILSCLEQKCQLGITHDKGDPAPSHYQAECSDLKDRG